MHIRRLRMIVICFACCLLGLLLYRHTGTTAAVAISPLGSLVPLTDNAVGIQAIGPQWLVRKEGLGLLWLTTTPLARIPGGGDAERQTRCYSWAYVPISDGKPDATPLRETPLVSAPVLWRANGDLATFTISPTRSVICAGVEDQEGPAYSFTSLYPCSWSQSRLAFPQTTPAPQTFANCRLGGVASSDNTLFLTGSAYNNRINCEYLLLYSSTDAGATWTRKEMLEISGKYPCMITDGRTITLFFLQTARGRGNTLITTFRRMSSADSGRTWSSPEIVLNEAIVQYAMVRHGDTLYLLTVTPTKELNDISSPYYKTTCAFNYNVPTVMSLRASADNGLHWSKPVSVTDGTTADYYPAITLWQQHLYLAFARLAKAPGSLRSVTGNIFVEKLEPGGIARE